jgi:enediyne polyketide synthase
VSSSQQPDRANTLRLRWPYVRRVLTSVLPEPGRDALIDQVAQRYLAPFPPVGDETLAGGLANTIAGRICNHFDFHGGGLTPAPVPDELGAALQFYLSFM